MGLLTIIVRFGLGTYISSALQHISSHSLATPFSVDDVNRNPFVRSLEHESFVSFSSGRLASKSCTGENYQGQTLLPYLESSNKVHKEFDSFPAFLIDAAHDSCMIRPAYSSVSHLQLFVVDLASFNEALVCDGGLDKNGPAGKAKQVKRKFDQDLEYDLVIPYACQRVKAACAFVTALHGKNGHTVFEDAFSSRSCLSQMGVIMVLPKIHGSKLHRSWEDLEFLRPLIKSLHAELADFIDFSRLYLYGQSMGGSGAIAGGLASADLFADVFSVSPQHFWTDPHESIEMMESVVPKWHQREASGERRLKRMMTTIGGTDAIHGGKPMDVGTLPRLLARAGVFEAELPVEIRFFPNYGHVSWIAAFNVLSPTLWQGGTNS